VSIPIIILFICYMIDMLIRSYSDRSYDRNRVANSNRERDYDRLKQKCEIAMQELMMLRRYIIILILNTENNLIITYFVSLTQTIWTNSAKIRPDKKRIRILL